MCQTIFKPSLGQGEKMPFSVDTLVPSGPRKQGQSLPGLPELPVGFFSCAARRIVHCSQRSPGKQTGKCAFSSSSQDSAGDETSLSYGNSGAGSCQHLLFLCVLGGFARDLCLM